MPDDPPAPRQISLRYDGAADYVRHRHYLRRLRSGLVVAAVLGTLAAALGWSFWGKASVYSPGPISLNHTRLSSDCRACHQEAGLSGMRDLLTAGTARFSMDEACLRCHAATRLHLPQSAGILMAAAGPQAVVHATGCAECHREHAGRERMAPPAAASCLTCHGQPERLQQAPLTVSLPSAPKSSTPADGVVRFLPAPRPPGKLPPMTSFAEGHPAFRYEKQPDPGALIFSHQRHFRADVTWPREQQGIALCGRCHQPGANGAFMQPIRYEKDCQACHALQFRPDLPQLLIPHGKPDLVRAFLAGREETIKTALRTQGVDDARQLQTQATRELQALKEEGLDTLAALEQRVFFEGDPPNRGQNRMVINGAHKVLDECALCHRVTPATHGEVPHVERPALVERWLQRGAFTHLPHQYMQCEDCHGAARQSRAGSDLLLPPQTLCAQCHRPAAAGAPLTASLSDPRAIVSAQLQSGGVKAGCTDCHRFHSPPDAVELVRKARISR